MSDPDRYRQAFQQMLDVLDLRVIGEDHFEGAALEHVAGEPISGPGRLFGGQVAAQSVVAAGRTVAHGSIHSLHAYFLRPGGYDRPIRFAVDRIRDGRTFTTRRVVAYQGDEAIFSLAASFCVPEQGGEFQEPMPRAPDPDAFVSWDRVRETRGQDVPSLLHVLATDVRVSPAELEDPPTPTRDQRLVWMKARGGSLPDDPLVHAAFSVYVSDRSLIGGAMRPLGARPFVDLFPTSLDHAMWFHKAPRFDDWVLYVSDFPAAANARALALGGLYTREGARMCSVAQEGLMRAPRKRA